MKLTQLQQSILRQSATADGRSEAQMLGFLLAEGLRFYWQSKETCWGPPFNADKAAEALDNQALGYAKHDQPMPED